MTEEELLALVSQDSDDYDETIDGWLNVSVTDGIMSVQVEKSMGGRFIARWRLESCGPVEEERS